MFENKVQAKDVKDGRRKRKERSDDCRILYLDHNREGSTEPLHSLGQLLDNALKLRQAPPKYEHIGARSRLGISMIDGEKW